MRAALSSLAVRAGSARSVAVLGEMAELGAEALRFHREVGQHAATCGVDVLVGIGELARGYRDGAAGSVDVHWFASPDEAAEALRGLLRPDDVVLLKASRAAGLEKLDEAIA
jgi:UDP-N-acetylmuramoyl-tripeptide--D-alanyl-D-alanine ligase